MQQQNWVIGVLDDGLGASAKDLFSQLEWP
jgi:hypothetical protein